MESEETPTCDEGRVRALYAKSHQRQDRLEKSFHVAVQYERPNEGYL